MRWGFGAGALEAALSPSSASDHLGNSRFKPDLQCPGPHPWARRPRENGEGQGGLRCCWKLRKG